VGFMDKAKKMAEQAQAKLDEAQKQFNSPPPAQGSSAGSGGAPPVEYDQHGRPIQPAPVTPDAAAPVPPAAPAAPAAESAAPPAETPGVPPTESPQPPAPEAGPTPDPAAPETPGAAPSAPAAPPGPAAPEDRNRPSTEPPKLSSGDPLAG
jgi:hypothetical protein